MVYTNIFQRCKTFHKIEKTGSKLSIDTLS